MSILQRRFSLMRRYILGVLILVPLVFAPGAQPKAALVTDGSGLVTDITSLSVDGFLYDISFESDTYNALFGGVFFANAGNFVTEINAVFNVLNPLTPLINSGSGAENAYLVPEGIGPVPGVFILAPRGRCTLLALGGLLCSSTSAWSGGTTLVPGVDQVLTYAVPTLVSAVPLPAALPLFGSALAMLGIVGWRRKRRAAA